MLLLKHASSINTVTTPSIHFMSHCPLFTIMHKYAGVYLIK